MPIHRVFLSQAVAVAQKSSELTGYSPRSGETLWLVRLYDLHWRRFHREVSRDVDLRPATEGN